LVSIVRGYASLGSGDEPPLPSYRSLRIPFVPVIIFLVIFVFLFVLFFFVWLFSEENAGGVRAIGGLSAKILGILSMHAQWYASPPLGNERLLRLL